MTAQLARDIMRLEESVAKLERFVEVTRARGLRKLELALSNAGVVASEEARLTEFVRGRFLDYAIPFQEQYVANKESRIDFVVYVHPEASSGHTERWAPVCPWTVGVELKTQGTTAQVIRQLDRYAELPEIDALVLVTTKRRMASQIPRKLRDIPVLVVCVGAL